MRMLRGARALGAAALAVVGPLVSAPAAVNAAATDWVGPGHVDVATDDAGQDWMLYHAAAAPCSRAARSAAT